ncbi:hypothetical protein [Neobacillus cucumis]|jgi:hypothetical protein|uniref:hypothetical protein n=1 Tax=Neobacillus cucumis TaxID=1740721 RepID=UPI002E1C238D|nr:hypothetical protein [Neobacillus cucumis]
MRKKDLLVSGLVTLLTFGGIAGCGDGVDQDNGISDGQQKDAVDTSTINTAKQHLTKAKENLKDIQNDVEKEIKKEDNN